MDLFEFSKWAHILAGGTALATFWLPWVVRKGGRLHRWAGWTYVAAMAVVCESAVALVAIRLSDDASGNDAFSLFLGYVAFLSCANASMGVRVLRTKRRTTGHRGAYDVAMASLFAAAGGAMIAFGAVHATPLFAVFGALGVVNGGSQLNFWARPPATRMAWLYQHVGGMGGACIATVTAFVVVNTRVLGLERLALVAWIAPGVVGAVGITLWNAHLRRRYDPPRRGGGPSRAPGGGGELRRRDEEHELLVG